jgi:predicted transcriptional regulator
MKPTEILRRYSGAISLIDDAVLETIDSFEGAVTIQQIVVGCQTNKISSPATTHKAIHNLMREGFIRTSKNGDGDNRKHWVELTSDGKRRTKDWK